MRFKALALVVVLAAAGLGATVTAPPVVASQNSAPWWDPPDVRGPQDFADGWNFRVPLRVDNPWTFPITKTHPILAHLEMNRLAAEAGWLQTTAAGEQVARSFTFDLDSVRLIEYQQNWIGIRGERTAIVEPQWLDPDQSARFGKIQNQAFDARTNPVITLSWFPETPIPAGGSAYYFVYFEAQENSEKDAVPLTKLQQERFDAATWIGRATELWGHTQGSVDPSVSVDAIHANTQVTVYEYKAGFPRPTVRDISPLPNPFTIAEAGGRQEFSVSPSDTPFKIEADKPVLVSNFDGGRRPSEFIPSTDDGLLGTRFRFVVPTYNTGDVSPPAAPFFYVARAPSSQSGVTVQVTETDSQGNANTRTLQIGSLQGYVQDTIAQGSIVDVQSSGPILIQPRPYESQPGWRQAPSVASGSPYGTHFYVSAHHLQGFGVWRLAGTDTVASPSVYALPPDDRLYPDSGGALIPLLPGLENLLTLQLPVPGFPANAPRFTLPHYVWSTDLQEVPPDQQGPISVRIGQGAQDIAPIGGRDGRHFVYRGPVAVFAHHDATVLTHHQGGEETTFLLAADGLRHVNAPLAQWQELQSNKPVAVVPVIESNVDDDGYLRWLAGRLAPPPVEILKPEFRGYLVQVRSPDGADPIFKTTKPGQPVTVPVEVTNLGRWIGGVPLADTITVKATPQAGWGGQAHWASTGSSSAFVTLGSQESQNLDLVLTPPASATAGTATSISITATSGENPNLSDRIQALLLTEQGFGVKLWWDVGQSTTVKDITRSLDAGDTRTFRAFLENTGSGKDSYTLSATSASLGWGVRVESPTQPGQPLTRIADVQPGEKRPVNVVVTAPSSTDQEAQTSFIMQVFSESSASTADLLQAFFQLNLRRQVNLDAGVARLTVLPGASVEFPLRLVNAGESEATIGLEILDGLPAGWNARFEGLATTGQTAEITLIPPQEHEFRVNVTASADARFGDFVPLLVQASLTNTDESGENSVSLLTLVGRTIDFTATTPTRLKASPGETVPIHVNVTHRGNSEANMTLVPAELPGGWATSGAIGQRLPVPADADDSVSRTLTLNVTVPPQALAGSYTIGLQAVQMEGGARELDITVDVAERLDAGIDGPERSVPIGPNETISLPVVVRNLGNAPLGITASTTPPPGWAVTLSPREAEVAPGTNRTIMVAVTAPHRDDAGAHLVSISINDIRRGAAETVRWDMQYGLPDVEVVSVTLGANAARIEGDVLFLTSIVVNRGNATAVGVPLQLVVDGEVVDQVSLGNLAPNGTAFATLQMAWPGHVPTIEVVVNPSEALAETNYANNGYPLDADDVPRDPPPNVSAPGFVFLLFAVVTLAFRHRRRVA